MQRAIEGSSRRRLGAPEEVGRQRRRFAALLARCWGRAAAIVVEIGVGGVDLMKVVEEGRGGEVTGLCFRCGGEG